MNKLKSLWSLCVLISTLSLAQNSTVTWEDLNAEYTAGFNSKILGKMKSSSQQMVMMYPESEVAMYYNTYTLLCQKLYTQAQAQAAKAITLNPINAMGYYASSYAYAVNNDLDNAKYMLHAALLLERDANVFSYFTSELELITHFTNRDLSGYLKIIHDAEQLNLQNSVRAEQFINCFEGMRQGKKCDNANQLAATITNVKGVSPLISKSIPYYKAVVAYIQGDYDSFKTMATQFVIENANTPYLEFFVGHANYILSDYYAINYAEDAALIAINNGIVAMKSMAHPTITMAHMMVKKSLILSNLQREEDKLQNSYELLDLATQMENDYFIAKSKNSIGTSLLLSGKPGAKATASEYIYDAYQKALTIKEDGLIAETQANYATVLFIQGRKKEANALQLEILARHVRNNNFENAANTANTIAAFYYYDKDYARAATKFEEAISYANKAKENLTAKQKLEFTNDFNAAQRFVAMCYAELNKSSEFFEAQEASRASYLNEVLNKSAQPETLATAQSMLKNDEVLLMYSLGKPGEIFIHVITNNSATIKRTYPLETWIQLKKKYAQQPNIKREQINPYLLNLDYELIDGELYQYTSLEQNFKAENFSSIVSWTRQMLKDKKPNMPMLTEFLRHWYNVTLSPVLDIIENYKNVIISTDGELAYLPFETFVDDNNRYFVESHNVRYIPSVSVWKSLLSRNYSENRLPLIAFGGAHYQPSGNVKGTARSIDDFTSINASVREKVSKGIFNFKEELNQMGFGGAQYLDGTLKEVQYVGNLDPKVKIVTGWDMTESNFKNLNDNGTLKKYKILMVSTHGFTMETIPEFSGLMFSQPDNGDKNEDTFLLVPEIARLNLNADLVVLSACDTGIGKIYGGEGISGLNTAFMQAGANSTLLSLWPVNDAGTAITMQNFYKNVLSGTDLNITLNEIKRGFIRGDVGDFGKTPSIWAPFVLNGL